jgi:hypothetical protein
LFLPAGFSRPVFGLAGFNCRVATYIGCAAAPHASFLTTKVIGGGLHLKPFLGRIPIFLTIVDTSQSYVSA